MSRLIRVVHGGPEMGGMAHHPHFYDLISRRVARRMHRRAVMDACVLPLRLGAQVVDVGTGPGRLAFALAAALPRAQVEGVDLSPEMTAYATRIAGTHARRVPSFRTADVASLPYEQDSVDLIISTASAHHWEDLGAGIRELGRVLSPSGQAMIYDTRATVRSGSEIARAAGMRTSVQPIGALGRLILRTG